MRIFYFCSLESVSCFLCFCLVASLCFLCMLNLFVKKIKRFKTALITSFTLLLNSSYYKHEIFNLNFFQLSQSFSIITIFFNYHNLFESLYNLFELSQTFSIIKIFFNYHNLLYHNPFQSLYNF